MDTLTREQRADVISRAIAWARLAAPDISRALEPVDDTGSRMNHLALAIRLLEDGRRYAVQALDAAREHIQTVSGHPGDSVEAEVVRVCIYAAHRLDGSLATGLDPELMASEERVAICHRAFEIASAALDHLDAEHPELVTDVDVLSAALSLTSERLVAIAGAPRTVACTWCGDRVPAVGDAWLRHALECDKSPGALCYRHLTETFKRLTPPFPPLATPMSVLDMVRDATADVISDAAALVTEAENARLLREGLGQQHERDCPTPLEPHATCEEPDATPHERREWERDYQPEQRVGVAKISKTEFDSIPKQLVTEKKSWQPHVGEWCTVTGTDALVGGRTGQIIAEVGEGSAERQVWRVRISRGEHGTTDHDVDARRLAPPPAAFGGRSDDQSPATPEERGWLARVATILCEGGPDETEQFNRLAALLQSWLQRFCTDPRSAVSGFIQLLCDVDGRTNPRSLDLERLRQWRYVHVGRGTPVDDQLDRLLGPWSDAEAEAVAERCAGRVVVVHGNPCFAEPRRRTYASYDQAALAVAHATHLPADEVRLNLRFYGVQVGEDTWRLDRR